MASPSKPRAIGTRVTQATASPCIGISLSNGSDIDAAERYGKHPVFREHFEDTDSTFFSAHEEQSASSSRGASPKCGNQSGWRGSASPTKPGRCHWPSEGIFPSPAKRSKTSLSRQSSHSSIRIITRRASIESAGSAPLTRCTAHVEPHHWPEKETTIRKVFEWTKSTVKALARRPRTTRSPGNSTKSSIRDQRRNHSAATSSSSFVEVVAPRGRQQKKPNRPAQYTQPNVGTALFFFYS
ncbi:hypothetical protein B0I35DRAFT_27394 [Stachybotrys elegans]|uniref:Uncharacterized protein n=1 Tax=Stachybotrys elegans TaxID=80388 RepID=A0A8K0WYE1_9HYPO|nr:hypothetical protein B0I35DRAFT_27394 [Stachybotrys elegans]